MKLFRAFLAGFYLWVIAWIGAFPASAQISCDRWNTKDFFEEASVADISRCLKTRNPNARDKRGQTPLHLAAEFSTTAPTVKSLVNAGARVNARDEDGLTPLHRAIGHGKSPELVAVLLKVGAKVNAKDTLGSTPLHHATQQVKTPAAIKILLKFGAEVNVRNNQGWTPLHFAAGGVRASKIPLTRIFASLKARIAGLKAATAALKEGLSRSLAEQRRKLVEEAHMKAALKKVWQTTSSGYLEIVSVLIKAGAKIDAKTQNGVTPLHEAAGYGIPKIVAALLDAGANPTAKDKSGKTPWDYAKENPELKGTDVYWRLNEARFK